MKSDAVLLLQGAVFLARKKAIAGVHYERFRKKCLILQNNLQQFSLLTITVIPIHRNTTRCSVIKLSLFSHKLILLKSTIGNRIFIIVYMQR